MTYYEKLVAAGLPVISADETGACSMGEMTPEQQQLFQDITMEHFDPASWADVLAYRQDKQQLRTEYQAMINRLVAIENAVSPTPEQVIQAVKDIAKYERLIVKFLFRQYRNDVLIARRTSA